MLSFSNSCTGFFAGCPHWNRFLKPTGNCLPNSPACMPGKIRCRIYKIARNFKPAIPPSEFSRAALGLGCARFFAARVVWFASVISGHTLELVPIRLAWWPMPVQNLSNEWRNSVLGSNNRPGRTVLMLPFDYAFRRNCGWA